MIFIVTNGTSKLFVGSSLLCHPEGQVFSEWAPGSHRVQARPGKDNPRTRRTVGAFPHIISLFFFFLILLYNHIISFNLHSHLARRVIIWSSTTSKFFTRYSQILFLKCIYLFVFGWAGLPCCAQALSSCGQQRPLLVAVHVLIVVASLVAEHTQVQ